MLYALLAHLARFLTNPVPTTSGVIQGSVWNPLLVIFFINYIFEHISNG